MYRNDYENTEKEYLRMEEFQFDATYYFLKMFFRRITNFQSDDANTFKKLDMQLSVFIINSFSKLFDTWNKHPPLKRVLNAELFYNVFSQMCEPFNYRLPKDAINLNDEPTPELKIECGVCDEEFSITKNNVELAYADHLTSPVHVQAMKTFEGIRENDEVSSSGSESESDESASDGVNEEVELQEEIPVGVPAAEEHMDSIVSPPIREERVDIAASTTIHDNKYLEKSDESYIIFKKGSPFCSLCDIRLPRENYFSAHINGNFHKQILEYRRMFIVYTYGRPACSLCNYDLVCNSNVQFHVTSSQHVQAMQDYEKMPKSASQGARLGPINTQKTVVISARSSVAGGTSKSKARGTTPFASNFIYLNAGVPFCSICKCNLSNAGNITSHVNGTHHKQLLKSMNAPEKNDNNFKISGSTQDVAVGPGDGSRYVPSRDQVDGKMLKDGKSLAAEHTETAKSAREDAKNPARASEQLTHPESHHPSERVNEFNDVSIIRFNKVLFCFLCDCEFTDKEAAESHIQGSSHKQALESNRTLQQDVEKMNGICFAAYPADGKNKNGNEPNDSSIIFVNGIPICSLCNCTLHSVHNIQPHINGKFHQETLEYYNKTQTNIQEIINDRAAQTGRRSKNIDYIGGVLYCTLCQIKLHDENNVSSHLGGKRHHNNLKERMKKFADSKQSCEKVTPKRKTTDVKKDGLFCNVCNVYLVKGEAMLAHVNSSAHTQILKCQRQIKQCKKLKQSY